MRNPLSALRQIAIKHADHPLLIASLLLAVIVLTGIQWLPASWQLPVTAWFVLLYVSAASLNTYRLTQQRIHDHQRQMQALMALHQQLPFRAPIPSLSGWAATPELMVQILNTVRSRKPRTVLELGSGASTVMIPYMLEQTGGGRVFSIDHEEAYAASTRRNLALHGVEGVTLNVAPLTDIPLHGARYRWYDLSATQLPDSIDMLIVDGPPEQTNPMARYPALPLLWDRMSDGAVILMDDADRPDEQEIIRRWKAEFDLDVDMNPFILKGFALLTVRKTETGA